MSFFIAYNSIRPSVTFSFCNSATLRLWHDKLNYYSQYYFLDEKTFFKIFGGILFLVFWLELKRYQSNLSKLNSIKIDTFSTVFLENCKKKARIFSLIIYLAYLFPYCLLAKIHCIANNRKDCTLHLRKKEFKGEMHIVSPALNKACSFSKDSEYRASVLDIAKLTTPINIYIHRIQTVVYKIQVRRNYTFQLYHKCSAFIEIWITPPPLP